LQLQARTFEFAKNVLDVCPRRFTDEPSQGIWRQLVRSAPSASGNFEGTDEASSDADFVFKMKIATREMKESSRWLRFIAKCKLANHERLRDLEDEGRQLASIFATIVVNTKRRIANEKAREHQ